MGNCSTSATKLKEEFHVARQYRDSVLGELRVLASDKLGRQVALKQLSFDSRTELEQFVRYAELALQYDNIPTLVRLNTYSIGGGGQEQSGTDLSVIVNFDYYPSSFAEELKRRRQHLHQLKERPQGRALLEKVKLHDYELIQTLAPSDRKYIDLFYL